MGISSMIKEARMYNGGKIVSSTASEINDVEKTGQLYAKESNWTILPYNAQILIQSGLKQI